MNETIMRQAGFGEQVDRMLAGKCPFCQSVINPDTDFRDEVALKEYNISGLCQNCQDDIFGG